MPAPQITVKIVGVTAGAGRKLLETVSVSTLITIDTGGTAADQQQAVDAVATVTTQMTEVRMGGAGTHGLAPSRRTCPWLAARGSAASDRLPP